MSHTNQATKAHEHEYKKKYSITKTHKNGVFAIIWIAWSIAAAKLFDYVVIQEQMVEPIFYLSMTSFIGLYLAKKSLFKESDPYKKAKESK